MAVTPRLDVDYIDHRIDLVVAAHNIDLGAAEHWIDLTAADWTPIQDLLLWVNTPGYGNTPWIHTKVIWNRRAKLGSFFSRTDLRNSF